MRERKTRVIGKHGGRDKTLLKSKTKDETNLCGKKVKEYYQKKAIKSECDEKQKQLLEERTSEILERLSPRQLRKMSMNYFSGLMDGKVQWTETLKSIKMEGDFELVEKLLATLYQHSRANQMKSFKFGHLLVTSQQSELIMTKGMMPIQGEELTHCWRIPATWSLRSPHPSLATTWTPEVDSKVVIAASRLGKDLDRVAESVPELASIAANPEGKVKAAARARFAYLVNVYQHRGSYNAEFSESNSEVDKENINEASNNTTNTSFSAFDLEGSYYEDDYIEDYHEDFNDVFMDNLKSTHVEVAKKELEQQQEDLDEMMVKLDKSEQLQAVMEDKLQMINRM